MTLTEMIAKYNELATAAGKPVRKGFENKSAAEVAIKALSGKGAKMKIAKVAKAVKQHQKGPRGFTIGPVWLQSIRDGKGVALKAANMPKLLDTASVYGVNVTKDLSQAEIAAMIAKQVAV